MKQFSCTILFFSVSLVAHTQTAVQQQSTTPTAASDNAITMPTGPAPAPATPKAEEPVAHGASNSSSNSSVDEPTVPTVKKFPVNNPQEIDPTVAVPALKNKKVTLIGGIVREIDPIRNRMTVDIYGGKPMKVIFDDRTKVSRNGADSSYMGIRKGDRVYLDTQIYEQKIFAKQIQIVTKNEAADVSGQVVSFDPNTRELELRDSLSARPFTFRLDHDAAITANGGKAASVVDLQPGALITAHFNPGQSGRGSIRDVNVLAAPGAEFTLYGIVNHLDLRAGTLAVQNKADDKAYEVKFDPAQVAVDNLRIGSEVSITARFDGEHYIAQSLNVTAEPASANATSIVESDEDADTNRDKDKKDKNREKKDKSSKEDEGPVNPK
jgi:hypothetical protein